jgi:ubiquinone/menaquinone biosynthesis C-methylase UbiE
VTAIDISPDLIAVAEKRLSKANVQALLTVGDAYNTGLPDESVDVVFCIALIHHLDLRLAREEVLRILRKGGVVILKEPVRFSNLYNRVRKWLPEQDDVSEYEHPLTREEFSFFTQPFKMEETRFFRLPFVPLVSRLLPSHEDAAWKASDRIIKRFPLMEYYASGVVTKLHKA